MAKYSKRKKDGMYATSRTFTINGVKKKYFICGKTIKEVDDKIAELTAQAKNGIQLAEATLGEWADEWLETYKKGKIASETYNAYYNDVNVHIKPNLGMYKLTAVTHNQLQRLLNDICNKGNVQTARKVKTCLNQIYNTALTERVVSYNPAQGLELPSYKPKEKRALTNHEIDNIAAAPLSERERLFVGLLYYAGLRRGEALALTADDINIEKGTVKICKKLSFGKNQGFIETFTKTEAGMREIPIAPQLLRLLPESQGILIEKNEGGYMTKTTLRRMWESIKKKCMFDNDVTPHTFRHNFATRLYYAGVDVKTAQYLLGHKDIKVTLSIYTHLDISNPNKTADAILKAFNSTPTPTLLDVDKNG